MHENFYRTLAKEKIMKKIILTISVGLLLSVPAQASTQAKVATLEENVRKLEEQLHAAVEELNTQLAVEAEKGSKESVFSAPHDSESSHFQVMESFKKRLDDLETRLTKLEKNPKDLEGARSPEEAKAMREANEKAPKLPDTPGTAQYNLAFGLLMNNELEKAKEAFEQLIKTYPADFYVAKSQVHLGDIFKKLGDLGQAEDAYQKALAGKLEEPVMVECRLGLAEVLFALGKNKLACDQVVILEKEQLDEKQKLRLKEFSKKSSCPKEAPPK